MDKDIKSFDATAAKILVHLDEECPGRMPAFLPVLGTICGPLAPPASESCGCFCVHM